MLLKSVYFRRKSIRNLLYNKIKKGKIRMKKMNSKKVLKKLIDYILTYLDEMQCDIILSEFAEGGKYAFLECLEIISCWKFFHKYGIDDIEKTYPL